MRAVIRAKYGKVIKYAILWIFQYSEFIPAIGRFSNIGNEHRCYTEGGLYQEIMHQSFATTDPSGSGNSGDIVFA